ncbi:tyrosine-type recombinase/integrase [Hyphomicrobium sp. 802]|uniref:tyrosine-type recombinase/integrase n=1 Tax=Hyphomicrobium sp. 802 TaxID=1112272 RepID=UPI00045E86E4|nr:tyrosine-type recombinase/integrase [Hyphomicrobium sp. 802]
MPSSKLPRYVWRRKDRKGRWNYYFRYQGTFQRLPDDPDSAEFHIRYGQLKANIEREPTVGAVTVRAGTLAALIRDFKESPEFAKLGEKSKVYYRFQLDRLSSLGPFAAKDIGRAQILKLRDKISARGYRTADQFIQVASRLFTFGIDREVVFKNPAAGVKKLNDEESYLPWSDDEAKKFEESKPPQWMMTAYMLGRWTTQRRGDILKMTRDQYDGSAISILQGKTKKAKDADVLVIACHSELKKYLDALSIEVGLLVPGPKGQWDESAFSKQFRAHLDGIGLQHLNFHGLRHKTATELAESDATDAEIMAVTGHSTTAMVRKYTRRARQKKLAASAMAKLERPAGTPREHESETQPEKSETQRSEKDA